MDRWRCDHEYAAAGAARHGASTPLRSRARDSGIPPSSMLLAGRFPCRLASRRCRCALNSTTRLHMSPGRLAASNEPAAPPSLSWLSEAERDKSLDPFRALVAEKKFHCTMCGKCCTGSGEVRSCMHYACMQLTACSCSPLSRLLQVWVTDEEAAGIARHLSVPVSQFFGCAAASMLG